MLSPDKDWILQENESVTRSLAGDFGALAQAAEPLYDSVLQRTQVLRVPAARNFAITMHGIQGWDVELL